MSEPYYKPLEFTPYPDRRFLGNFISQDSFLLALHASWKDLSYDEIVDVFNEAMNWCYNGGGHPENTFNSVEEALEKLQRSLGEICYYCNGSAKTGKALANGWALTELGCKRVFRKACVYCIHAPIRVIRTKLMGNKTFGVCRLCGNYRSGKTVTELSCGIARGAEKAPKEGTSTYHLCFSCKKH